MMTSATTTTLIDELPADTFTLSSRNVAGFINTLRQRYGLSAEACVIAEELLLHCFSEFGGYEELASNSGAQTLAYHNGSHAAYVMTVALHLGIRSGASQTECDALAIAGAGHDYLHQSNAPGEDETNSARLVGDRVQASSLHNLAPTVRELILGTTLERIDHNEIHQRAAHADNGVVHFLADADLSSFATPYAGDWALRLYKEQHRASRQNQQDARTFLEQTAHYQRNHQYLSRAGQDLLGQAAPTEAARLEVRIAELVATLPA